MPRTLRQYVVSDRQMRTQPQWRRPLAQGSSPTCICSDGSQRSMLRPVSYIVRLLCSLRHYRPGFGTRALAPQSVQLAERGFSVETSLSKVATHDETGASDPGSAMDINAPPQRARITNSRLQLLHLRNLFRHLGIAYRAAQIVGMFGQQPAVVRHLVNFRQIDKIIDSRGAQAIEALARIGLVADVGMLARKY